MAIIESRMPNPADRRRELAAAAKATAANFPSTTAPSAAAGRPAVGAPPAAPAPATNRAGRSKVH